MHEHKVKLTKHCWCSLTLLFVIALFLTACGRDNGDGISPEYHGVKYTGQGTLETKVNVVIYNEDEVLFLQTVKIIDDNPTVWKALKAISDNVEQGMPIEKDQEGKIVKVDGIGNNQKNHWELFINNVIEDGDIENIGIDEEQPLTLRYTAHP
ncbi:hypothetical protein [Paenibacillus durus]|uniref:DUF4430 domain-containing protein n=1 Tax=Paenibacillus durus ATCC 35681 TaxID=1333534 RepID=A0A0F7F6I3_PAEDU|nr:hypothetical protein [Paenibacillus durus]AKG33387.1 hypothetical protein VK70_01150 [Paenibacillus durus ATCC 35681]